VGGTTAPPSTAPQKGISLNLYYFRTAPGIVKLIQLVLGILCMACTAPAWTNGTHWFLFVVVTAFVATALWCFIYLLSLRDAITLPIDWQLTEVVLTGVFTVLLIVASIVQFVTTLTNKRPPPRLMAFYILGGVFGLINFMAYLVGCFFLYRDWKDAHPISAFSGPGIKRNP